MRVKTVIEPIFEADSQENWCGSRPRGDTHLAMDNISLPLRMGKFQVIDVNPSKYFDTLPTSSSWGWWPDGFRC
jgi:hypothetical protein